ncbi:LysM peptidoglycan-binding domain-containing protein [Photobacterium sp. WH24]|uniref:LysM peptidoglycan-binding domain-containing protein n=1 Tax=Photobacterium sp. WH24 TaxID=2827237 RepID=UPI001C442444|nr:LysM domain-containing protein [Photobacterium sp. WH24]MBV7264518.1 LysM peptidoglycan-binding domain-containing protein [Photobacterium sp. WH24]
MTATYTVQPDDTLLEIAIEHQIDFNSLLQLNPQYQPNPDFIRAGDTIKLPEPPASGPVEPTFPVEPVASVSPPAETCTLEREPLCQPKEIEDIVFLTGDPVHQFYVLDKKAVEELEQEIEQTQTLFQCYMDVVNSAPPTTATKAELEAHVLKREALCQDLAYAGLLPIPNAKNKAAVKAEQKRQEKAQKERDAENTKLAQAKVTELKARLKYIENYGNWISNESSTESMKEQLSSKIKAELTKWEALAGKAQDDEKTKHGAKKANLQTMSVKKEGRLDAFHQLGEPPIRHSVREVYSVARDGTFYLRGEFVERVYKTKLSWMPFGGTSFANAFEKGDFKALGKAIQRDFKNKENRTRLGESIGIKLNEWVAPGNKIAEWKSTHAIHNEEGNTWFAVTPEAQLGRWGMQASLDANLNPLKKDENGQAQGKIDLGISASAAFSVAEAAVTSNLYLPSDAGTAVQLHYTDKNKQPAVYSFGCFRVNVRLKVGCFLGVSAQVGAGIGNGRPTADDDIGVMIDPNARRNRSNGSGLGVMFSPRVEMGTTEGGQIGVKADVFAGAQFSGEFAGDIEWQSPKKEDGAKFSVLAGIKTEGNVAIGGGYTAEFALYLDRGKFFLKVSAKLVWGVGAGGGVSVTIDARKLWDLAKVIWEGLQYVDYRVLKNINEAAYNYLVEATYYAFALSAAITSPVGALKQVVSLGNEKITQIRLLREESTYLEEEAKTLALRILDDSVRSGVPFDQLLPEAIGMMLDTLVRTFLFNYEELQETAIYKLLHESTYSWHKFEEILQRMNSEGKKKSGDKVMFHNLKRINAILDGSQQSAFNEWVMTLMETNTVADMDKTPFTPRQGQAFYQKRSEVEQQVAMLDNRSRSSQYA